jgi:hypothetical protein
VSEENAKDDGDCKTDGHSDPLPARLSATSFLFEPNRQTIDQASEPCGRRNQIGNLAQVEGRHRSLGTFVEHSPCGHHERLRANLIKTVCAALALAISIGHLTTT